MTLGAPPCPVGFPQAACDLANGYLLATQPQPAPTNWDSNNVLETFRQWYASTQGPTTPPSDPAQYLPGQTATSLIIAAANYWETVAGKNPTAATAIDPNVWNFPWQYAPATASDAVAAAKQTMDGLLADPASFQKILLGQNVPFDPTKVNWNGPLWTNPANWPTLGAGADTAIASFKTFMAKGNACGLFQKPQAAIQAAWAAYSATGADPCIGAPVVQPGPVVVVPGPTPKPVIVVQPAPAAAATTSSPWIPIAIAGVGLALAGTLAYTLHKRKMGGPAMENPHMRVDYRTYRASVANQLMNRYAMSKTAINNLMSAPSRMSPHTSMIESLFKRGITVSHAANKLWQSSVK